MNFYFTPYDNRNCSDQCRYTVFSVGTALKTVKVTGIPCQTETNVSDNSQYRGKPQQKMRKIYAQYSHRVTLKPRARRAATEPKTIDAFVSVAEH